MSFVKYDSLKWLVFLFETFFKDDIILIVKESQSQKRGGNK